MNLYRFSAPVVCLAAIFISGCASTQITEEDSISAQVTGFPQPNNVIVTEFAYADGQNAPDEAIIMRLEKSLKHETPTTPQAKAAQAVAQTMQACLAKDLRKELEGQGMTVTMASPGEAPSPGSVVIEGVLVTAQGNVLHSLDLGLAVGETNVVSQISAYYIDANLKPNKLVTFDADASGVSPQNPATTSRPDATTIDDVTLADNRQITQSDAVRTSEQVAKKLGQFFYGQGWTTPSN